MSLPKLQTIPIFMNTSNADLLLRFMWSFNKNQGLESLGKMAFLARFWKVGEFHANGQQIFSVEGRF